MVLVFTTPAWFNFVSVLVQSLELPQWEYQEALLLLLSNLVTLELRVTAINTNADWNDCLICLTWLNMWSPPGWHWLCLWINKWFNGDQKDVNKMSLYKAESNFLPCYCLTEVVVFFNSHSCWLLICVVLHDCCYFYHDFVGSLYCVFWVVV